MKNKSARKKRGRQGKSGNILHEHSQELWKKNKMANSADNKEDNLQEDNILNLLGDEKEIRDINNSQETNLFDAIFNDSNIELFTRRIGDEKEYSLVEQKEKETQEEKEMQIQKELQEIESIQELNQHDDDNINMSKEEKEILSMFDICPTNFTSKLNIDEHGDIIYDDKSRQQNMLLNENSNIDGLSMLIQSKNKIDKNLNSNQIENYKYAYKRTKSCKWTEEETKQFFNALEMFGADLMMVNALLPKFTDKQIRDKYKKEKKKNPLKVEEAVKKNKEICLDAYEKEHGKIDYSTHYKFGDCTSSSDDGNNSIGKDRNVVKNTNESDINILSLFNDVINITDAGANENTQNLNLNYNTDSDDFNILNLF